jgi:hypothetical protein
MAAAERRAGSVRIAILGLLLIALWSLDAAPAALQRMDRREKLRYGLAEFYVEHRTTATADDLGMPFYPNAEMREGFVYVLTDADDKSVNHYALARLTTPASVEKVAQYYSGQLRGHPKPEQLKDAKGERTVVAVGSAQEVRMVTLRRQAGGCEIELVRAATPRELKQPPAEQQPQPPVRPRGPRGPGGPRRPRGPGERA